MFLSLGIILLGVLLSALFNTFETALISSDPLKIYAQVKDRQHLKKLMNFFQNPSRVINALVVAITLVNITVATYSLNFFRHFFSLLQAGVLSAVFSVLIILIFGEIIPKIIAFYFPKFIILYFFNPIRIVIALTSPIVFILNTMTHLLFPKLWQQNGASPIIRKEVELLFYKNREGVQSQHLVEMIYRVLSIDNVRIKEAKIPISEIVGFNKEMSVKEFKQQVKEDYYSRVPIYKEDIFNITGYVSSSDVLFSYDEHLVLEDFQKKAIFFPENKPIDDVIEEMEAKNTPLAFVVDEFGAVSGMVTKKDLTELIIGGSIQDEKNTGKGGFIIKTPEGWVVSGRQDIDELNDRLGLGIKKDGFETLSGFIMWGLKDIPIIGDTFYHHSFLYQVKDMEGFFVSKIEITYSINNLKEEGE